MAEKEVTSFNSITSEFMGDFIRENATQKQWKQFEKAAFPAMYAVPNLDETGAPIIIPAHLSKTGKKIKEKPSIKWTSPINDEQEKEYISKGYKKRESKNTPECYNHLRAKNWLISSETSEGGGMREKLIEKGYEKLIPADKKPVSKSAEYFGFLFKK